MVARGWALADRVPDLAAEDQEAGARVAVLVPAVAETCGSLARGRAVARAPVSAAGQEAAGSAPEDWGQERALAREAAAERVLVAVLAPVGVTAGQAALALALVVAAKAGALEEQGLEGIARHPASGSRPRPCCAAQLWEALPLSAEERREAAAANTRLRKRMSGPCSGFLRS